MTGNRWWIGWVCYHIVEKRIVQNDVIDVREIDEQVIGAGVNSGEEICVFHFPVKKFKEKREIVFESVKECKCKFI